MKTTLTPSLAPAQAATAGESRLLQMVVIIVGLLSHATNLFGYPMLLGDEGIVMQNAWAVLRMGYLTPYTYWYDNPPAGWLVVAAWTALTGGFQTFGLAVDGGRVLMLVIHALSAALLVRITLHVGRSQLAALAAGLLFAISPLSVVYGRMVLLDNLVVFWLLASALLLVKNEGRLWAVMASATAFALAVLTKEIAAIFLPVYLIGLWTLVSPEHRRFARAGWLYAAIALTSIYALFALLKSELVNTGLTSPLADSRGAVTLVGALAWQLGQSGGMPWDPASDFARWLDTRWLAMDPWLIGLGTLTIVLSVARGPATRRFVGLLGVSSIVALAHGGPVLEYNVLLALPFLAICAGLLVADVARSSAVVGIGVAMLVVALSGVSLYQQREIFTLDVTTGQRQALSWIRESVPAESHIIIDDDLWVDLREGSRSAPAFPHAHSHWKAARDPAVWIDFFEDAWQRVDYVVVTPGMRPILAAEPDRLPARALDESLAISRFGTGGATVEVHKVAYPGAANISAMNRTWEGFKQRYVADGQVRLGDTPVQGRHQAAAMLMAVWMDDRATFDQLWGWTRERMLDERGLLYGASGAEALPGTGQTEADTDAAMALIMAANRWGDEAYRDEARTLVGAIYRHYVVKVNDRPYLAAGDWAITPDRVVFAPAAFSPAAYHLFAATDPTNDWWYVLDTNYALLSVALSDPLGEESSAGLPPSYVGIDRASGRLLPNPSDTPSSSNIFTPYAAEAYWRLALDARLHDDGRAARLLERGSLLANEWRRTQSFSGAYTHRGTAEGREESFAMYAAALPLLAEQEPALASELFAIKIAPAYTQTRDAAVWTAADSIDEYRLAWIANALYGRALNDDWSDRAPEPTPEQPDEKEGE